MARLDQAVHAPLPHVLRPQLATLATEAPEGAEWIHEVKFDGYRILAFVKNGRCKLVTRNGKDWTARFGVVSRAVEGIGVKSAILDGEMVALDAEGRTNFEALRGVIKGVGNESLVYYVFDMPYLDGKDLRRCALSERRAALQALLEGSGRPALRVRFSEALQGHGREVLQHACRLALEGIISKRANAPYSSGRGTDWVKSKCTNRQEMVIGGYTDPQHSRQGFGALLLGHYRNGDLLYAGKVGTGFDRPLLTSLLKLLKRLGTSETPFTNPPGAQEARGAHWVRPELVCEVEFFEWTKDARLRHPSFVGLREDKDAQEVVRETRQRLPSATKRARPTLANKPERVYKRSDRSGREVMGVTITHPDREVFPEVGVTKGELAEYYSSLATRMMPFVRGRPLSVVRCPQGQGSQCFYQKNWPRGETLGSHVRTIRLSNTSIDCLVPDEPRALVWLVQHGALEVHTWGCGEPNLERPDVVVFDLDPDVGLPWTAVVRAAQRVRGKLKKDGLESVVKTSGGKGLHVMAFLNPVSSWDRLKAYSKGIAEALVASYPAEYVATMSKAKRSGKVFIDYLRNARGATFVAPYSSRSRAGAPISMPVTWSELPSLTGASQFTVRNALAHLDSIGDAWKGAKSYQLLP